MRCRGAGMRRRRWRTAVLWVGCTSCVLIAVAFVVSGWWLVGLQKTGQKPAVGVSEGCWFFTFFSPGGGTPIVVHIPIDYLTIPTSTLPRQRMPNWELWNLWDVLDSGEDLHPTLRPLPRSRPSHAPRLALRTQVPTRPLPPLRIQSQGIDGGEMPGVWNGV